MPSTLRICVRFLQPYSHGRGEDGAPEWPPSPLRLFQALVASSLGRQADPKHHALAANALRWLERQAAPEIVAPAAITAARPFRLFVPDNVGDKIARSWSAHRDATIADYRTEKEVHVMHLDGEALHYVFRDVDGLEAHLSTLQRATRAIVALGWGVDLVVGDANSEVDAMALKGERWIPGRRGGPSLRCPIAGTLDALEDKHRQFLGRLDGGTFRPVPALAAYTTTSYARATDPAPIPFAAFRIVEPTTGDRLWLDPTRRTRDVAAWLRHAVAEVCESWPYGATKTFIHGHDEGGGRRPNERFAFLPLPTINPKLRRVEGLARVMLVAPTGYDRELEWARIRLAGHELVWKGEPVAVLEELPERDSVVQQYVGWATRSRQWSTVTPVILPGHDDHHPRKTERLIRKALGQAGFEPEVVDRIERIEWQKSGFFRGTEHADRYRAPDKLTGPRFHLRVRFATEMTGPVAIGSGRFRGMGVLARDDVES